jgi:hypothetical protein
MTYRLMGRPLSSMNLLCARDRAAVNDDPLVRRLSRTDEFVDSAADTGKAGAATESLESQPACRCIRKLPDV